MIYSHMSYYKDGVLVQQVYLLVNILMSNTCSNPLGVQFLPCKSHVGTLQIIKG